MKKGKTLKDLAVRLNMSVSTVSKALNDNGAISELTKERVKRLAADWNYIPNEAARHFKQNKTFTLGLIVPDLLDQFYVLAVNGVEEVAAKKDYNVIISQSHENPGQEEAIVGLMIRSRVDGVIAAITKHTVDMAPFHRLQNIGIPVIFFARSPNDAAFNYVSSDNEVGAMQAVAFLLQKGHRRIGHLMGPAAMPVSRIRLDGYKKALQHFGLPYDAALVEEVDFTTPSNFAAMERLMRLPAPPTAIFSFKNYVSLDVIRFLKEQYPAKAASIDVVGFGNLPLLQHLDYKPAASIDENSRAMGVAAAEALFMLIESEGSDETPSYIKVPCKLVVHD